MNDSTGRARHDAMLRQYLNMQGMQSPGYTVDMKTKLILVVTPGGAFAHPIQLPTMRENRGHAHAVPAENEHTLSPEQSEPPQAGKEQHHER